MKILILLAVLSSFTVRAEDDVYCPLPQDIVNSSMTISEFKEICNQLVKQDPGCLAVKPELRLNCESGTEGNKLLSSDNILEKIGGCLKGLFVDSIVDIGKLIVEMISTLVDVSVSSATQMYKFFSDEKYRGELLSKFENSTSDNGKLISSFFRMSAAYFAQEFNKNLKDSYYNPIVAIPKTFLAPFVKFLSQSVEGLADQYIKEYHCLNGPARANSICQVIGTVLVPPTLFFAYLKGGKAALLMQKNLRKGKGLIASAKATHDSLVILKASSKLNDTERVLESAKALGITLDAKRAKAIIDAHNVGLSRGYFKYTPEDIAEKAKILKQAGLSKEQRRILMDRGLVGGAGDLAAATAAKEANLRALGLSVDVIKTAQRGGAISPSELKQYKLYIEELRSAAREYQAAAKLSKSPTTLSKSWLASLKAGDTEGAFQAAKLGMKEFNMSPEGILRNLRENYEAKLLKAKDYPNNSVIELELKSMRQLEERLKIDIASRAPVQAPTPAIQVTRAPTAAPSPAPTTTARPATPAAPAAQPAARPTTAPTSAPAAKPAPVAQNNLRAPEVMTPREASDAANTFRLARRPEEASTYYLRAAKKRSLDDRDFSNAIYESMKGEGSVALQVFREGKKDGKLLNELMEYFHDESFQHSNNPAVKNSLKKIVDELNSNAELRNQLHIPTIRILDNFNRHLK